MPPLHPLTKSCVAIAVSQLLAPPSHAATISVDTIADSPIGTACSLRRAINSINTATLHSDCTNNGGAFGVEDTIDISLPGNHTLSISSYYYGEGFTIAAGKDVTINGSGQSSTVLTSFSERTFYLSGSGLNLNDMTIRGALKFDGDANGGTIAAHANSSVGLTNTTIDTSRAGTGGGIYVTSSTVTMNNSAIVDTRASIGGAIYAVGSNVNISNSTLSGNSAQDIGAIYAKTSTVTIANSTIANNSAYSFSRGSAGGIKSYSTTLSIANSTLSGNSAYGTGGGIHAYDSVISIIGSTVTGNSARVLGGGGIFVAGRPAFNTLTTLTISNSLITGNQASGTYATEILNLRGENIINANANNLFGDSSVTDAKAFKYFAPGVNDINSTSDGATPTALAAIINPLANNGGPTYTHELPLGSPALDNADSAICAAAPISGVDQRGLARDAVCDIGAFEFQALSVITIDSASDTLGGSDCTLRNALEASNSNVPYGGCVGGAFNEQIVFDESVSGTITLSSALPKIQSNLTITGPEPSITINAAGNGRVFEIDDVMVGLSNLNLIGGSTTGVGGGISILLNSEVSLSHVTVSANSATKGGGIYAEGTVSLTIGNSTISGNSGTLGGGIYLGEHGELSLDESTVSGNLGTKGGGVYAAQYSNVDLTNSSVSQNSVNLTGGGMEAAGSYVDIANSTFAANSATGSGGGIRSYGGSVSLSNSTLSGNSSGANGGAVYTAANTVSMIAVTLATNSAYTSGGGIATDQASTITLKNTLISGNDATVGADINNINLGSTFIASNNNNLFGDNSHTTNESLYGVNYGTSGTSNVIATSNGNNPASFSAIASPLANNGGLTLTHLLPAGSPALNEGSQTTCLNAPINSLDQRGVEREQICDIGAVEALFSSSITINSLDDVDNSEFCNLRNAIYSSNYNTSWGGCTAGDSTEQIYFEAGLAGTITLSSALASIFSNITIKGPTEGGITINADGTGRVFDISGGTVEMSNLNITGGLTEFNGGGIYISGDSEVALKGITISGNVASTGGGIFSRDSSVSLSNSTLSGNSATLRGGAMFTVESTAQLSNVTIANNSATQTGGGLLADRSSVTLSNNIIAGNVAPAGAEVVKVNTGSITANNNNLFGDSSVTNELAFDQFTPVGSDITATLDGTMPTELSSIVKPLAANGGVTSTHALASRSPAIDTGDVGICAAAPINNLDQRGEMRDANCDIGATEFLDGSSFWVIPLSNGKVIIFEL